MKGTTAKFNVAEDVCPKFCKARTKVDAEIERLVHEGILSKVSHSE